MSTAARPFVVANTGVVGRTGSTLLMELLRTSDRLVVPGTYPYEERHLHHLVMVAASIDPTIGQDAAGPTRRRTALLAPVVRRVGGRRSLRRFGDSVPPPPAEMLDLLTRADADGTVAAAVLESSTTALLDRVCSIGPAVGFVEKCSVFVRDCLARTPVPLRTIWRVRDPRDAWVSITAMDRRRGSFGFGRRARESERSFLERFISDQRLYFHRIAAERDAGAGLVVRYEDLVADVEGVAARVGALVGAPLDSAVALERSRAFQTTHATSRSVTASVGRFRTELDPNVRRRIEGALAPLMADHGYEPTNP